MFAPVFEGTAGAADWINRACWEVEPVGYEALGSY
jgi:hypothetical protein